MRTAGGRTEPATGSGAGGAPPSCSKDLPLHPGADIAVRICHSPSPPAQPPPLTGTPRLHISSACIFIAFPPQDMYLNLLLVNITTGDANMCRGSINNSTRIDTHTQTANTDTVHQGKPRSAEHALRLPPVPMALLSSTKPRGFLLLVLCSSWWENKAGEEESKVANIP